MITLHNIKAIIFDIDGTLIDSLDAWGEADRDFLAKRNIPYSPDISKELKTLHFVSASQYLIDRFSLPDSLEDVCREITENVRRKYFYEIPLMPCALEFISDSYKKGIKMCAATSNSRELAEGALKHNRILDFLEFIITSDEVGSDKSSPDIFLECCKRLSAAPNETAVFEDSPHAAETARNAGFTVVGVNNGHFGDFEALSQFTDLRIESFGDITAEAYENITQTKG